MVTPQTIEVASLGMWDSLILMVLALVVFGPRRLPEIGRQIGKLMYEVRKASNDFKFQMEEELRKSEDADRRAREAERLAALPPPAPAVEATAPTPLPDGQFPTPNPYREAAASPDASAGDSQRKEPYPLIQPPSTGEPVPAERPGRMMELGEAPVKAPAKRAVRAARAKKAPGKAPGESADDTAGVIADTATTPAKRTRKKPESANG
jgi:sec-independent protein translocase protein TatB